MGNGEAFFDYSGPLRAKADDGEEFEVDTVKGRFQAHRLMEGTSIGSDLVISETGKKALDELNELLTFVTDERTLDCFNIDIGKPGELLGRYSLPTGELITAFPMEAPWMSGMGACLINIVGLRKDDDGVIWAKLGDEEGKAYPEKDGFEGFAWCKLDSFPNEWPQ